METLALGNRRQRTTRHREREEEGQAADSYRVAAEEGAQAEQLIKDNISCLVDSISGNVGGTSPP